MGAAARHRREDPNHTLEDIERDRAALGRSRAQLFVVGGGAVLDLATAMRIPFRVTEPEAPARLVVEEPMATPIPLLAVPTTAGTGAEPPRTP